MASRLRLTLIAASATGMLIPAAAVMSSSRKIEVQSPAVATAPAGWVSLFDGTTLNGWDGRSDVWKVDAGTITGEVAHGPSSVTDTTYTFWKGGDVADFELTAEIKTDGRFVNSGILYRAFVVPSPQPGGGGGPGRGPGSNAPYKLAGPQLDFDAAARYAGQYFDVATGRLTARRGQVVEQLDTAEVIGSVGEDDALGRFIKPGDWNQLRIIAQGKTLIHMINGHVMAVLVDRETATFRPKGLLALQLEGAGRVRFRNIWLKAD
jgi:Domain of Unknown Function (DUF1080)